MFTHFKPAVKNILCYLNIHIFISNSYFEIEILKLFSKSPEYL